VHIFSYWAAILDLATVKDWGEEIFLEGVGVNWKKWDDGIENPIYYLAMVAWKTLFTI